MVTKQDLGRFGYALGVMITGAFVYDFVRDFTDPVLWVTMVVASAVWVVYYNRIMIPKFDYFDELDEDDDDDEEDTDPIPPGL